MIRLSGGPVGLGPRLVSSFFLCALFLLASAAARAAAPSPGGNIVATNPAGGPTNITEDDPAPGAANIRITPTTLMDADVGEDPDSIRLISITGGTVAQGNGSPITLGASGTVLPLTAGNYDARFTPSPNRDIPATIQYVVVDPGGIEDSAQSTITINITPVNDDPPSPGGDITATNTSGLPISINEDAPPPGAANIRVTPLVLSDPDTVDHPPTAIRLLNFTGGTVLQANGDPITLGAAGTVLNLSGGTHVDLRFTPAPNRDTNVIIPYVVVDPSGVADSPSSNITVNITPAPDPPLPGGNIVATNPAGGATNITEDDPAPGAANIRVTPTTLSDPDTGENPDSIRLISITGGTVAQGNGSAITLGAAGTVLALTGGNVDLRFTPTPNRDTAAIIAYVVVDPGGVADSSTSNITVNITPVPDPPSPGGNIVATSPGGGPTNIIEDDPPPGSANIRVTPTTLSDPDTGENPNSIRLLSFTGGTVAQGDGSAIVLGPAGTILPLTAGSVDLRFTPAPDRDTAVIIPYVVVDPGGVADSTASNITVNIVAVNDAPTFSDATLADILENAANPPGATLNTLFGGSFMDVDGDDFFGVAVVFNPQLAGEGVWQYRPPAGNANDWYSIGAVTDTATAPNALVLRADTFVRFLPALNFNGNVTAIQVRALDDTYMGGFSNKAMGSESRVTLNTSTNGGATPISAAPRAVNHFIIGVNNTPTEAVNLPLNVNQGSITFITNSVLAYTDVDDVDATLLYTIVSGPANGVLNLTPTFTQGNINTSALSYTHNGSATTSDSFTFNVRDDEGATTADATFNIVINLTPTVTVPIADVQVNENAPNTVINLLTSFDDAESGPGGLTYTVSGTAGDPIFDGTPMVSASNLTLAYAPNAPGTATVTVRATDPGGAFVEDTFQVSVNARPIADDDFAVTSEDTPVSISVLVGDSDPDGTIDPTTVTVTTPPGNGATMVNAVTGVVTYTPALNFNGMDTFQYTVADNLGFASAPATVTVTVTPVNDAPVLTVPGATQMIDEGSVLTISAAQGNAITVADVDADETPFAGGVGGVNVSLGATLGTLTLATTANLANVAGNGTMSLSFDGTIADTANALNGLLYTPAPFVSGNDTITITVSDKGNTGAGGVLTDTDTIAVAIAPVNDPPVITVPGPQTVNEDVTTPIAGISVADPDAGAGDITVTLSVGQGTISVNPAAAGGVPPGQITGNGSNSVTLLGTVSQQNATLATVTFRTALNLVTDQSITILANDNGNTGGPPETDMANISISVTAQNDDPFFTNFPGVAQAVAEDTPLVFSTGTGNRITVEDVDHQENNPAGVVRATLAAGNGTLTLGGTAGLTSVIGNGTGTVIVEGSTANLNTAFNGLTYLGSPNFNGLDQLTVTLNDLGNTGVGGGGNVAMSVNINVSAVNDPPSITVPGPQTAMEDVNFPFSAVDGNAIVIVDVDANESAGELIVTLAVTNGTLSLTNLGLSALTGNGTGSISMRGTLAALNSSLDTLRYRGTLNFNGADTLSITANDQGNTGSGPVGMAANSVSITVAAVNDAPVLTVPGAQSINEDTTTPVMGISVADVDAGSGDLVVTLSVGSGSLAVSAAVAGGVEALAIGNNNTNNVTLTGTLVQLNNTLPTLTFRTAPNNAANQTLTVHVNDQGNTGAGGALTDQRTVPLNITAINDDPVIAAPGPQTINEDTSLTFAAGNGNAITITDVDLAESAGTLRVTLTVAHGRLTLATTAGLTLVTGTGANEATVTFSGTQANVNNALNGLTYQPDPNFNTEAGQSEALVIIANDQGHTGLGGGGNITASVAINIAALNDDPTITVPGPRVVDEDTDLFFNGTISVNDIDVNETPGGRLRITLGTNDGQLTLATTAGLTITPPATGTRDGAITFTGSLSAINAALNGLAYRGTQDYNGSDTLTVTANDLGNTGLGGGGNIAAAVPITITPVNDAPVASNVTLSPAEPLRNEDLTASYTFTDVDGDAESGTAIRWFRDGQLQPAFNDQLTVPMGATVEEEVWFFRVTPSDGMLPGAEVQSNSVRIRPVADLQISIARTPSQVVPGENVSYTYRVRNVGPSPVTGATVTSTLPAALQNVTWACATCGTGGTGPLNETVNLASGQTVEYVLTARVNASAEGDLTVSGTVTAPPLVFETNPANNTASDTVPLMPEASLSVDIAADRAEAAPGETVTYTVTATNDGPSDARGVIFGDTPDIHTALNAGSVTSSQGDVLEGNGDGDAAVAVNVGTLPLGASVTISYAVTIARPFPAEGMGTVCTRGRFFGEAGNPDVNFVDVEPSVDACTAVASVIDFGATKVASLLVDGNANGDVNPGDTVRYTVRIVNRGDGGANGVVYSHPAIANASLIENSVTAKPPAQSVSLSGGAVTVALGSIQGDSGASGGANEATVTFDVVVVNPLPPGARFLVSQGTVVYAELPAGGDPILTDDPGAVALDGSPAVPVDPDGNIIRPAPTVTPLSASPALVVLKSDNFPRNQEKRPGDTIAYTVTIENRGNRGATDLFYRNPFRDGEISREELQQIDGASPLSDVATSLLNNFAALDVNNSRGLSSSELEGSFFALTPAQFNELDASDARLTLVENSIMVNGAPAANLGTPTQLLLDLGSLDGRNPQFTNGPTITVNFTVLLRPILPQGINTIRGQGAVESDALPPVLSDDPETVNIPSDPTLTLVRAIPEIDIVPEILTINFGDQDIDDGPTPPRMIEISNSLAATANLTFGFVGLEGAALSDFVIVSDTGETVLAPGQTRFIAVAFNPDSIGNKIASLRIESDDPDDGAVDVNLSGRALDSNLRVTPSSLNFRKRNLLAGPSAPQSVSIINDGLGVLTLDSVTLACGPDIFPVMTQARFDELDLNGDGVLTRGVGQDELERAIDLFDVADILIDEFGQLDLDGSNSLSAVEVDERFPFLTDARFATLDANGSGGLSPGELAGARTRAVFADSLLASFADFDTSPPEGLDFQEAQQILPDLSQAEFATLDADRDGVLSREELEERRKLAVIAAQLQADFAGLDLDQNGALSRVEIDSFTPLITPGRFNAIDTDRNRELSRAELGAVDSRLADDILADFDSLDENGSGGLSIQELSAACDFKIFSDSGETALDTAQSRLVRVVFNPTTTGMKVGTLRIEANQQGQGTPIIAKVSLAGVGNRTPRIIGQNPVSTQEDTPVPIILDNLIVDAPLLDFPGEVTLAFQPLPAGANYTRDGATIIPNLNFNGALFVPVTVRDGNIDSNIWNLRIDVAPVNDPPTDITLSNNTILENQPLNTVIGRLRTVDPDLGDLHTYSLVPRAPNAGRNTLNDGEYFGIIADQLVSRAVFDYETRNTYTVVVRSRDPEGESIDRAFTIHILDQPGDEDDSVAAEVLLNNFAHADANGDGVLNLEEVQRLLPGFTQERFEALNVESEVSRAELQAGIDQTAHAQRIFDIFELADTNKDGLLTLAEARSRVPGLTDEAFRYMNLDGDGFLSPSELQTAILLHGDLNALLAAFDTLDRDGSGQLTYDELPGGLSAINRTRFNALDTNPGLSQRELQTQVACVLLEGGAALIRPTGDLLAPPGAALLDVTFNAEVDVNAELACDPGDITFTYDIGAESILITDMAEFFLQNFASLDANFNGGLSFGEVAFSRLGITPERFAQIDFDGDTFLIREELEAAIVLSDFATVLLENFAALNTDNSTGLSFAETQAADIELDMLRYSILDLNNNGVLTRRELEAEIDLPDYLLRNFDTIDTDRDGALSPAEVVAALPGLSQTRFDNLDADRDGLLVPEELNGADDFGKFSPTFAEFLPPEGIRKQLRGTEPATFTLPVNNAYRVRATATLDTTGQFVRSENFTFEIRNGVDDNRNGYLDAPFSDLVNDGSRWQDSVPGVNCNRAVLMHYWRGSNIPGRAIEVSLKNPARPSQQVDLVVPHGLLNEGEEGILILALSCDAESLLNRQQAEGLDPFPEDAVAGTPWIDVSVVVRAIGETEFAALSTARLALRPIAIRLNQLSFSPEDQAAFFVHGALAVDDPESGFTVVPGLGTWRSSASRNNVSAGNTLSAELTDIGLVVALESLKPPILVTSPDSASPIDMGEVPVNRSVERAVTITNVGGEQLVGAVELRDASGVFALIGEASYSLAHGETHQILIRFSPNAANSFAASVTYSGDEKGLITTAVNGTGIAPKGFGCGAGAPGAPLPVGNGLVILLTLAGLLFHHARRARQGLQRRPS